MKSRRDGDRYTRHCNATIYHVTPFQARFDENLGGTKVEKLFCSERIFRFGRFTAFWEAIRVLGNGEGLALRLPPLLLLLTDRFAATLLLPKVAVFSRGRPFRVSGLLRVYRSEQR